MRRWCSLAVLAVLLVACGRPQARGVASIEPLAISQRGTSPIEVPPAAAQAPSTVGDTALAGVTPDQAAIKQLIERANNAQAEAFGRNDPSPMRDTASDAYYQELTRINTEMARDGVSAIK